MRNYFKLLNNILKYNLYYFLIYFFKLIFWVWNLDKYILYYIMFNFLLNK
jgi:hypothetical protein